MSLVTAPLSDLGNAVYDYVVEPIICLVQDAINWLIYIAFYVAKFVCDVVFSFVKTIYNFVLNILANIIKIIACAINNIVSTLRAKLVPAFVVAVTPKGEELLIRYAIRGITHANSFKQGITRGILAGIMGILIPALATLVANVIDNAIPKHPVDVTNLLFPIRTLEALSSDICCPISSVTAPQCNSKCGVTGLPVCSPPCIELSNGKTYCFGVQFITQTSTSETPSSQSPPPLVVYLGQQLSVDI